MTVEDYIFCPLCGEVSWQTDKSRTYDRGRLESHKCGDCKKFTYTNIIKSATSYLGLVYFVKERYCIEAEIQNYLVNVFYGDKGLTSIRDAGSWKEFLSLEKAIQFNWYSTEEVISKIKKYLLFS